MDKELDYNKLGQIKKGIIKQAYTWGRVANYTYGDHKDKLWRLGWLQPYQRLDGTTDLSAWRLTEAGRDAYEQVKGQGKS